MPARARSEEAIGFVSETQASSRFCWRKPNNSRSHPARVRWGVGPIVNKRCPTENRANDLPLHAHTFTVNDPDHGKTQCVGLAQILFDNRLHLTRWNGVQ